MATAKIEEYADLARDSEGNVVPVGQQPPITTQTVTYTTANASSALNKKTRFVRIICDAKAHYNFTTTATASHPYVPADAAEYFGLDEGFVTQNSVTISFYDGTS